MVVVPVAAVVTVEIPLVVVAVLSVGKVPEPVVVFVVVGAVEAVVPGWSLTTKLTTSEMNPFKPIWARSQT